MRVHNVGKRNIVESYAHWDFGTLEKKCACLGMFRVFKMCMMRCENPYIRGFVYIPFCMSELYSG